MSNEPEFYNKIYMEKPDKWSDIRRDTFAYEALQDYAIQPLNMLDFGCGNGHTLGFFKSHYPDGEYAGVDISEIALKLAKWNIAGGDFYASLPEGRFNLITLMGVAEHLLNPVKELSIIGEQLSEDGLMYIEVPNCLNGAGNEGFRTTNGGAGQQEWHWKRSTWEKVIKSAGFDIVEEHEGTYPEWEFIWILKRS